MREIIKNAEQQIGTKEVHDFIEWSPPSLWEVNSKTPSGSLKLWIVLNPIGTGFLLHVHTYDKVSFIN